MTTRAAKTPAAIYVRISSDSYGDGLGVARQRTDCEALADRLGWDVTGVYEDNDVSASTGRPRPEYERMTTDIAAGRVRAVVVWDVDRLTRTPRELEDVIDFADKMGLKLASVGGDIDLGTEQGKMLARMKGTVARYEVEQSKRRLRRKHEELAAAGRHNGPRPYGWDLTKTEGGPRTLTVNPEEAAVVRECVDRVLRGEGLWRIANDLNRRGVPTSTGTSWASQTLRRVLLRWRNCGVRTHRGQEVGAGQWEPIIDRDTHERVVATLTDPSRRKNNRGTDLRYLLTNVALCGACERPVVGTAEFTYTVRGSKRKDGTHGPSKERHYPHAYKCPHAGCMKVQRRMVDVDEYVEGVVIGLLERDGVQILGGNPTTASAARERIAALEAKLALAADQYADDAITADQLKRISARVRPELDAERDRLRLALPNASLADFSINPAAAWKNASLEAKRKVLSAINLTIRIDPIGPGNGHLEVTETVIISSGRTTPSAAAANGRSQDV